MKGFDVSMFPLIQDRRWKGEYHSLNEWVTPNNSMTRDLAQQLTKNLTDEDEKILACWKWVVEKVQYPFYMANPTDKAEINLFHGKYCDVNDWDWWDLSYEVIRDLWSDCEGCAFCLASLIRTFMPSNRVFAVLGYVEVGEAKYGHGWVQVIRRDRKEYILEGTLDNLPTPLWQTVEQHPEYHPEIKFNDEHIEV